MEIIAVISILSVLVWFMFGFSKRDPLNNPHDAEEDDTTRV